MEIQTFFGKKVSDSTEYDTIRHSASFALQKNAKKTELSIFQISGDSVAHLYDTGRAQYVPVTDEEAVEAFEYLSKTEGIIPAIESAHAVAYARKIVPQMGKDQCVVITISGRGDKDCAAIARYRGEDIHE